jgi:hypothetical protein
MTSPARPAAAPRTPPNRDRVLRAAAGFADERGISSPSMRKLGEAPRGRGDVAVQPCGQQGDLLDAARA